MAARRHRRLWTISASSRRAATASQAAVTSRAGHVAMETPIAAFIADAQRSPIPQRPPAEIAHPEGLARRSWGSSWSAAERRGRDLVACGALLVVTLPLAVVAACLIKLDSPVPVFYRQARVGRHGKTFTLLKFRSMRTDAERDGPRWASVRDPRVTRVGGFLRLTRIDELPQLFNVLRGDMSLIGPRPERPHFVDQLAEVVPDYQSRHEIPPGITGWAQVNYPYGASVEDARHKLTYDLYYLRHRSRGLDFRILLRTVRVVLFGIGAR